MTVNDVHCHFFSPQFFAALGREKHGVATPPAQIAAALGWDDPVGVDALADRWVAELDRHRVERAALIASVPGDEESVAAAVRRHPQRVVGFFVINPLAPDALDRAARAFGPLGLRAACLFAALHRYPLDDPRVGELFEVARAHGGAIFAHCGYLSIEARLRLGLASPIDLRCGDPLALATTAARYPQVPVVVPHFGAGFLREALMAAEAAPNIHLDSSSSNGWIKYSPNLTLTDVFRQAIALVGPERILFGTDSSFFPRGWRRAIMETQRAILDELGLDAAVCQQIFHGNFDRLFPVRVTA